MINKLEIVKYLIDEIEEEQRIFKVYEEDVDQAEKKAEEESKDSYWHYLKYEGRRPSRSRIKDNCKKIRQLILDISKEIE